MAIEFPSPLARPIDLIATTDAIKLIACPLRFAFSKDPQFQKNERTVPSSALGIVSHLVREAAYRCASIPNSQRAEHFENLWNESIQENYERVVAEWFPAVPPKPELWKRYQLVRAATLRAAVRISEQIPFRERDTGQVSGRTGIEIWRTAPKFRLRGRVDRIDRVGKNLRVVEFKSGRIFGKPSPEHIQQLLLNAALVFAEEGEWPSEISLEPAVGAPLTMRLDSSEALEQVKRVSEEVDSFNDLAEKGLITSSARPDRETCRFCPYRPMCGGYWDALGNDWGHGSVLGEVTGIDVSEGLATVTLARPVGRPEESVKVQGINSSIVTCNDWLACCDLEPVFGRPIMRLRWSSLVASYPHV